MVNSTTAVRRTKKLSLRWRWRLKEAPPRMLYLGYVDLDIEQIADRTEKEA
jgi:hypothetical protein